MNSNKLTLRFTGKQLAHISSLCRKELSEDSISVLLVVGPTIKKIDYLGIIPAFTSEELKAIHGSPTFQNETVISDKKRDEKCERVFEKWCQYPESCNTQELKLVIELLTLENSIRPESGV